MPPPTLRIFLAEQACVKEHNSLPFVLSHAGTYSICSLRNSELPLFAVFAAPENSECCYVQCAFAKAAMLLFAVFAASENAEMLLLTVFAALF